MNVNTEVPRYKFLEETGTYIEGDLFAGRIEGTEILELIMRENLQRGNFYRGTSVFTTLKIFLISVEKFIF